MKYKFNHSILGGTFDHLHVGHMYLIDAAFENSKKITIGVATNPLYRDKVLYSEIESYDLRLKNLKTYLEKRSFLSKAKIIVLDDFYGNSLTERNIDAIYVTEQGVKNAELINKKREELGFSTIEIVGVPMINADDNTIVSSTRIRSGEINREGNANLRIFNKSDTLVLPNSLRDNLKKPFGRVISNDKDLKKLENKFLIAVGDITTVRLINSGLVPHLSIYDLKTKRVNINDLRIISVLPDSNFWFINKPGTINSKGVKLMQKAIKESLANDKKLAIKIVGEEDLLTLPAIMLAPLGSYVLYGLRNIGMVKVKITDQTKKEVKIKFLEKFSV